MDICHLRRSARCGKNLFLSALLLVFPLQAAQNATDYAEHFNRGDELLQQLHFHEAVAEFREATSVHPRYLPAHQALVLGYAATECFDLAWQEVAFLRQAGAEPPPRLLKSIEEELPEKEAAAKRESNAQEWEAARSAAAGDLPNAAAQGRLSRALLQSCDFPAAQKQAYISLQLNPLEPQAQFVLASILSGDPPTNQDSIPHWKLYLQNVPRASAAHADLARAYEGLGNAYQHLGKDAECIAALEEGLKVDPENPRLENAAAWFYATVQDTALRNPHKALSYAQQAVAITKEKRSPILDTLGESFYVNGRFDEAIAAGKKALALYPTNDFYSAQVKKLQAAKDTSAAQKH